MHLSSTSKLGYLSFKKMLFNFEKKENEILLGIPPPPLLSDMNGCDMATPTSVYLYQQRVIWIFTRSILSDLVL